jgi:hypothetical protein
MKLFFILTILVYVLTVVVDLIISIKNGDSIFESIARGLLYHPVIISCVAIFVFLIFSKIKIYENNGLYGLKNCFAIITPPKYVSIQKLEKIISYVYEITDEWEGVKAKKSDIYFLTDQNNRESVMYKEEMLSGDSIKFTTKDLIYKNKKYPVDMVILFKNQNADTVTFYGSKKLQTYLDTVRIYDIPYY